MPEYMNNCCTSEGYYVICENIYDVKAFTNNHEKTIDEIMEWANKEDVFVEFGCLKNGQVYCRYHLGRMVFSLGRIVCSPKAERKVISLESELEHLLKNEFPSMRRHILSLPTIIASNKFE